MDRVRRKRTIASGAHDSVAVLIRAEANDEQHPVGMQAPFTQQARKRICASKIGYMTFLIAEYGKPSNGEALDRYRSHGEPAITVQNVWGR